MYRNLLKTRFIMIMLAFLLFASSSLFSTAKAAPAENGEWIAYPFVYPTVGNIYSACGEGCIGCAKPLSDSILFFDINKSAWTELEFDSQQTIRDLKAEGHVVFAYTDEFLIGYSAFTCDYDVIRYDGLLLVPTGYNPSYGCGSNLAFFVTNETMYVFDAKLGRWQEYDYGLPIDYSGSYYITRDDYVWALMYRGTSGEKQPKNVVYSLHTHSFNQLENGCTLSDGYLHHGFAGYYAHDAENYTLIGYSAYTNEFDIVQVTDQGYLCSSVPPWDLKADEITVYALSFRKVIEVGVLVRGEFYGYDTRQGTWSHTTVDFDYENGERYSGSWQHGGQFAIDFSILPGEIYKFIIYSGITGQFSIVSPGLIYNSVTSSTLCGGKVFVVYDIDTAWGYSLVTEQGSIISLDKPDTDFYSFGDDFCALGRDSTESNITTMYIYNSENNNWTTIDLAKVLYSMQCSNSEHVFAYSSYESPIRETVFYSSFLDKYLKCEFPVNSSVSVEAKYNLAWARSSNMSYLFDAMRGMIYAFDFMFTTNGLANFATCFFDAKTKTLYGYSVLSGKWTNLTISDTPYTCEAKGFIGLISSNIDTTYYSRYYAFNGLEDSWVELVPSGIYKGHKIGEKTALVIRSDMLYAFDPNGHVGTYNYLVEHEGNFYPLSLFTNSTISNFSFNQSTTEISFNVTGQDGTIGFCNITLPNTLVQNLWQGNPTILVDGEQPLQISSWTDGNYTYIYFTYVHSEHKVVIVPELSHAVLTSAFLLITLSAVFVCRKNRLHNNYV